MPDVPADSYLSSPPLSSSPAEPPMSSVPPEALSSSPAALSSSLEAPPMSSVADARVQGNTTDPCGSIDNDVVGDGLKVVSWNLKPGVANEAGRRSFVSVSSKELPLPSSSTAPLWGGGASSTSSSSSNNALRAPAQAPISPANNALRAPARAPISSTAPPLHDHQRSDRLAPPSCTGAIFRRNNTYNSQQRVNQSWSAPPPLHDHQRSDRLAPPSHTVIYPSPGSYGWHNSQRPGHNLYIGMSLPSHNLYIGMSLPSPLPGLGQPFIPRPTSAWVPPRAQTQPPVTPMGYNGVVPAYNAQFVSHLDTYQMPFNNFQRAPVDSTIRIRPPVDHQQLSLTEQIEYYFSVDNLCKDTFLRSKMDDQGWVPVSLIATFNRVKRVTTSTTEILNALRDSTVIEIQAEKIRRRKDWMRWLLPPSMRNPNGHGSTPHLASNHDDSAIHPLGIED